MQYTEIPIMTKIIHYCGYNDWMNDDCEMLNKIYLDYYKYYIEVNTGLKFKNGVPR